MKPEVRRQLAENTFHELASCGLNVGDVVIVEKSIGASGEVKIIIQKDEDQNEYVAILDSLGVSVPFSAKYVS